MDSAVMVQQRAREGGKRGDVERGRDVVEQKRGQMGWKQKEMVHEKGNVEGFLIRSRIVEDMYRELDHSSSDDDDDEVEEEVEEEEMERAKRDGAGVVEEEEEEEAYVTPRDCGVSKEETVVDVESVSKHLDRVFDAIMMDMFGGGEGVPVAAKERQLCSSTSGYGGGGKVYLEQAKGEAVQPSSLEVAGRYGVEPWSGVEQSCEKDGGVVLRAMSPCRQRSKDSVLRITSVSPLQEMRRIEVAEQGGQGLAPRPPKPALGHILRLHVQKMFGKLKLVSIRDSLPMTMKEKSMMSLRPRKWTLFLVAYLVFIHIWLIAARL